MSEWKEVKLVDICDELSDGLHKAPLFVENGEYVFVNAKNLDNGFIVDPDKSKHTTYEEYLKYKIDLNERTILYSIDGTIGNIARYRGEKCVLGKGACYIKLKENALVDYIYYQLQSPHFNKYIKHFTTGSTIGHISLKTMRNYEFSLPPLAEQKRIAGILSSLDDKIELNNKINDNLEKQAQALFKKYEECVPYCELKISDVAEINPDSYGSNDNWEFVNYLDTSSISQNVVSELQYIDLTVEKLPSRAKRKVIENDIVYSTVRPNQLHYGIISDVKPNMLVSTGFAVLRSKNVLVSNEYLYLSLTQEDTIEKLQQIAEQSTSTFPAIKPSDIGNCSIKVFKQKDAELLNRQLSAVFKKILSNNQENQRLTTLRDTLLPKLMSGEDRVASEL